MKKREDNIVYIKSFSFAVKIVELYKTLCEDRREFVLSRQLLKAGTSIGANIREAIEGQSKKDFIAKLSIALKETNEAEYWIELLKETAYIKTTDAEELLHDAMEIHRLLTAIIKSMKEKSSIND